MEFLKKFVEKNRVNFQKGGKFEKWYPVWDGLETFLFVPDHVTHDGVHVRDAVDLKRTMNTVIQALIPCLLFGMWNVGYQHYTAFGEEASFIEQFGFGAMKVLPLVIVSYLVGLGIEFTFCIIKKHQIEEGFLVSGMLIPLICPVDVPLWMVAVATAFAVVIGKEVFGGTGMNILNPALTARAFLFFAYPLFMSGNKVWIADSYRGYKEIDGFSGETQLGLWAQTVKEKANPDAVDAIMAKTASTWDLFLGIIPGSIGETSALACIIGAILLIATGVGSWKIMLSALLGGGLMAAIFNVGGSGMEIPNPFMTVPVLDQIFAGGFMFGIVYMATDPVSGAQTEVGKVIYGFFIGLFAIMIRVFNPAYPEGMMLAILFMNVMAPLIDHYVVEGNIKERLGRLKTTH